MRTTVSVYQTYFPSNERVKTKEFEFNGTNESFNRIVPWLFSTKQENEIIEITTSFHKDNDLLLDRQIEQYTERIAELESYLRGEQEIS